MPGYQHVDTSTVLTPEHLEELISAVQYLCRRGIDERLGVSGTSAVQCQALQLIRTHPGLPQRQLAGLMDQSGQAFGTLLARLLVRGYLVRRRARARAVAHELSALGRIMLHDAKAIAHEVLTLLFMPLTAEERQCLGALLEKVLDARWRLRFQQPPESPW